MHIILVHGAGGTPTTWDDVLPFLRARELQFTAVTNPMASLETDVANTTAAIDAAGGPVLLVGHSYGGAVISNAGRHPAVRGLVYVAAFAPDQGESVNGIVESYPPAQVSKYMRRGPNGEWWTDRGGDFWDEIAWDVPIERREALVSETRQSENAIFSQPTGEPAWRTLPSWYLVASDDRTLRTDIQRDMAARAGATTVDVLASHFVPQVAPLAVAGFIDLAATTIRAGAHRTRAA